MARRGTMPTLDISRIKGRDLSKAIDIKAYAKKTRYGIHPWTNGVKSNSVKSNSVKSNSVKSVKSRIAGATKTYLGNSGRHSLERGNKLASHNTVYRQLRKTFGMSAS